MLARIRRFLPDSFVLTLLTTVVVASLLPAHGRAMDVIGAVSTGAIALLFFMHGVRLSREAVIEGMRRWHLQLAIFAFTYCAIPLLGVGVATLTGGIVGPGLALGIIYLCSMPTTVQASIASASIARGNVAASVIASAVSNISGVVLAPLLVALLASAHGGDAGIGGIGRIMLILLLPFVLGQFARRWLLPWAERNRGLMSMMDKLTIVLAVYVAFSEAATGGIWHRISGEELALLFAIVLGILILTFSGAWLLGGLMKLDRADRATMLFSASHKSLATGAPMARILFPGAGAGAILLPLLIYHQLQLMLSAILASRMARRLEESTAAE